MTYMTIQPLYKSYVTGAVRGFELPLIGIAREYLEENIPQKHCITGSLSPPKDMFFFRDAGTNSKYCYNSLIYIQKSVPGMCPGTANDYPGHPGQNRIALHLGLRRRLDFPFGKLISKCKCCAKGVHAAPPRPPNWSGMNLSKKGYADLLGKDRFLTVK